MFNEPMKGFESKEREESSTEAIDYKEDINILNKERHYYSYLFELDYGNRMDEIPFIKDILTAFDTNQLIGANLFVGNNIYYPEFYLYLNFDRVQETFDKWLEKNYPDKTRKYNFFIDDLFNGIGVKSYNSIGLIDGSILELTVTPHANDFFLFPDKKTVDEILPPGILKKKREKVFICHASEDKQVVNTIFNKLQKKDINAFIDREGIFYGEDIKKEIDRNLKDTKIALICYSKNFISKKSKWIEEELNYFIDNNIEMIPVKIDLTDQEITEIIGPKKFYSYSNESEFVELVRQVNTDILRRK